MNRQLSEREWQALSEYLDNQLPNGQREKLEQLIRTDPELRNGLNEMKITRTMLRSVPMRKVPHNFMLTPAMVARRSTPSLRLFPVLRFSSALATLLVALSFLLQLLPGFQSTAALPAAAPAAMEKSAVHFEETPTVPILVWNFATGRGGGGGGGSGQVYGLGGGDIQSGNQFAIAPTAPADAAAAAGIQPQATPETMLGMGAAPTETPATNLPTATAAPPPTMQSAPTSIPESPQAMDQQNSNPILGIPPADQRGKMEVTENPEVVPTDVQQESPNYLLWAQIGLAGIAIITGLAALVIAWKNRS